jgi:hypothetical protein
MGINFNLRKISLSPFGYIPEMPNTFPDMVKTFIPVKAKQETMRFVAGRLTGGRRLCFGGGALSGHRKKGGRFTTITSA